MILENMMESGWISIGSIGKFCAVVHAEPPIGGLPIGRCGSFFYFTKIVTLFEALRLRCFRWIGNVGDQWYRTSAKSDNLI